MFEYLKSVSINRVMPTSSTSEALWHLEGMRHMCFLLSYWVSEHDKANNNLSNVSTSKRRGRAKSAKGTDE